MKLLIEKQYHRLRKFWAPMALHLSHIARYAPSIQNHIHLKTFAQILTIVVKQPLTCVGQKESILSEMTGFSPTD